VNSVSGQHIKKGTFMLQDWWR